MKRTLPNHLIGRFDQIQHLIVKEKLSNFAKDLIHADLIVQAQGGLLQSRQIIATIALPYLNQTVIDTVESEVF